MSDLAMESRWMQGWQRLRGAPNTAPAPVWSVPLLACMLLLQAAFSWTVPREWSEDTSPGVAPTERRVTIQSLGETTLAAYAMNLYLQTFDSQSGRSLRIGSLDQAALRDWVSRISATEPRSSYSLLLASRVYASAASPSDGRKMLDLVYEEFLKDPERRWPWLAHAVHVARHELKDIELAKKYARAISQHANQPTVPSWAKQLEVFLLEANNEAEAARRLLAGLIDSGQIKDQAELDFLTQRIQQLTDDSRRSTDQRHESLSTFGR
jgi:hypothetical protein